MIKRFILILSFLFVLVVSGCTSSDVYRSGQSSIADVEWQFKVHEYETTEEEVVDLLGKPYGYYHKVGKGGKEKYMLYTLKTTKIKSTHLLFVPDAQFASEQKESVKRVWFYVSDGVVTKILQSGGKPDLTNYVLNTSSEYPYCDNVKCKTKRAEVDAG